MAIYEAGKEDFVKLRQIVQKAIRIPYQCGWQFRIEVEGEPPDFDFYVNDISYGPTEAETEETKIGAVTLTFITGSAPVDISLTVRDNLIDQRVKNWFDAWFAKAINQDGTVNLPTTYIKKFKRFSLTPDGEKLTDTWDVIPIKLGDIEESREEAGAVKFPIQLKQFRSLGAVPGRS